LDTFFLTQREKHLWSRKTYVNLAVAAAAQMLTSDKPAENDQDVEIMETGRGTNEEGTEKEWRLSMVWPWTCSREKRLPTFRCEYADALIY